MLAHHSRKVLLAAMLAAGLSAPALANDAVTTTAQQTAVGQGTTELAAAQDSPVVVKESYATVTPAAAPRASGGGTAHRVERRWRDRAFIPAILGIRHYGLPPTRRAGGAISAERDAAKGPTRLVNRRCAAEPMHPTGHARPCRRGPPDRQRR
jgi:hypothetical protein